VKTPHLLGAVVAFCLPGLVAVAPALQRTAPDPLRAPPPATRSVEIRHREGANYLLSTTLPVVADVHATVDRALAAVLPGDDLLRSMRAALEQRYGARVVEEASAPGYIWWWNGEIWVLICTASSNLAIDFGVRGTVEVRIRDWAVLP